MEQGIGVQLAIEPQHQLRRFLKDLPQHLGNSFEAEDVHVTIVYPEEIARAALGTEERRKLPSVANKISERVGELSLEGISLNIVPNVIRPFKKFLGVEIVDEEDSSICDNVRWAASTEIEAGLGIKLRSYLPSYHA